MKVFFLVDFQGMKSGEIKEIADGYAKNFLIPKKIAMVHDASVDFRVKSIVTKKVIAEKKTSILFDEIESLFLIIPVTVRDNVLYGSVFQSEIKEFLLKQHSIVVSKSQILLDKPIKKLGIFKVPIKLSNSLIPLLKVKVVAK